MGTIPTWEENHEIKGFKKRHGIKELRQPYKLNFMRGGLTCDEFLSLGPHLYIPEFSQFPPDRQKKIQEYSGEPTGDDGQYTKSDIMAHFFYQYYQNGGPDNQIQVYEFDSLPKMVKAITDSVLANKQKIMEQMPSPLTRGNLISSYQKYNDARLGEEINTTVVNALFRRNRKLTPLRPWLKLPAWSLDQFCSLLEEKEPGDKDQRRSTQLKKLIDQAVDAYQIPFASMARGGYSPTNLVKTIRGKYNAAELIRLAQEIGVAIPDYMLPLLDLDCGSAKPKTTTDIELPTAHDSKFLDEIQKGIDRLKAEQAQPIGSTKEQSDCVREIMVSTDECLNDGHEYHATELAIAVECWEMLFKFGQYDKSEAVKRQIRDWLEANYSDLSEHAKKRIATLVVPNSLKRGGKPAYNP